MVRGSVSGVGLKNPRPVGWDGNNVVRHDFYDFIYEGRIQAELRRYFEFKNILYGLYLPLEFTIFPSSGLWLSLEGCIDVCGAFLIR